MTVGVILVTGGSGQLAQALARAGASAAAGAGSAGGGTVARRVEVIGRPAFDFERPDSLAAAIRAHRPALVVNAAAYTAVDAAEAAPDEAARANASGPGVVAETCRELGIPLVHISTDYVFDGVKGAPYVETDATNPTGVYGATKLAGERAVLAAWPEAVILRTSWVYAASGKNFLLTMLNAARRVPKLRVVADQAGCPTNADDLAAATLAVAGRLLAGSANGGREQGLGGIYHATGQGETTWHGFATAIFADAARHGWPVPAVDAIATADWPTPARRPPDSRLDCGKLDLVFGVSLPAWRESLGPAVARACASLPGAATSEAQTRAAMSPG